MKCKGAAPSIPAAVLLALGASACVPAPPREAPPPVPAPVAAAPVTPAPAPARPWDERALDAGAWSYDAAARRAVFAPSQNARPLVTMSCSNGMIRMTADLGAGTGAQEVDLKTSAGSDRLRFDGDGATLPGRDPRLDRIAFSRGRFALEAAGGRAVTLPVQSEIGRVIEDCRN